MAGEEHIHDGLLSIHKREHDDTDNLKRVLLHGSDGADRRVVKTDTSGNLQVDILSGGGAGTEYTEDAPAAANPAGGVIIGVRSDVLPVAVDADGDNVAIRATDKGELYVKQTDVITETNSATISALASSINVKTPGLGQATKSASVPVTLASDQGDTPVTLDGEAVVLGAGTAGIGKLTANSGVDIGDVDVKSLPAVTAVEYTFGADGTPIDNLYNAAAEAKTSDAKDVAAYRMATFSTKLVYAGAASAAYLLIEILVSGASTNYMKLMNGPVGSWIYDDTAIGSALEVALTFTVCGSNIKVRMVSANCDGTHTITSSNSSLYLRE